MRIETEINMNDYQAFMQSIQKGSAYGKNPTRKLLYIFGCSLLLGLGLAFATNFLGEGLHIPTLVATSMGVYGILYFLGVRQQRKLFPLKEGSILGPVSYQLDKDGIQSTSKYCDSRTKWTAVRSIKESELHIFLFIDTCAGFIFPKQSLTDNNQIEEFRDLVLQNAHITSP